MPECLKTLLLICVAVAAGFGLVYWLAPWATILSFFIR